MTGLLPRYYAALAAWADASVAHVLGQPETTAARLYRQACAQRLHDTREALLRGDPDPSPTRSTLPA